MANTMYNIAKQKFGDGTLDWDTQTFKAALLTGHVFDVGNNDFSVDIQPEEISGTGYTAGGATMTNSAPTIDTVNDWAVYDAADVTWATSTLSATAAVVYEVSTDYPICYIDFGSTKTSSSSNFTISWDTGGVFKLA